MPSSLTTSHPHPPVAEPGPETPVGLLGFVLCIFWGGLCQPQSLMTTKQATWDPRRQPYYLCFMGGPSRLREVK